MTITDIEKLDEVKKLMDNKIYGTDYQVNEEYEKEILAMNLTKNVKADEENFLVDMLTGAVNQFNDAVFSIVTKFFVVISELAIIILNIIRGFFLIVLSIFGVFVIALSAFPTLEGSFTQWLTKYINVYMWLAIGFMLQSVLVKVQLISSAKLLSDPTNANNATTEWNLLISICTIIGFLAIPTLSGWLINAATNSVGNKMGQSAKQVSNQVAKMAATSTTGGVSNMI